jgi:hypothetical protein
MNKIASRRNEDDADVIVKRTCEQRASVNVRCEHRWQAQYHMALHSNVPTGVVPVVQASKAMRLIAYRSL